MVSYFTLTSEAEVANSEAELVLAALVFFFFFVFLAFPLIWAAFIGHFAIYLVVNFTMGMIQKFRCTKCEVLLLYSNQVRA